LPDYTASCNVELSDLIPPTTTDSCGDILTASLYIGTFPITSEGTTAIVWSFSNAWESITMSQNIIIEDKSAPIPTNATLDDITGQCEVTASSVNAPTAQDTCVGLISATSTTIFPITTQGTTSILWTFDDGHGNTTTQTQNIIIEDTMDPQVSSQDLIVDLQGNSAVSIAAEQLNNGSFDNCGVLTLEIDTTTFTDTGTFAVTLTGTDGAGNYSDSIATVTVIDSMLSSEDVAEENIKLYPVPVAETLFISMPHDLIIEKIEIYDGVGRLVFNYKGSIDKVDLSALSSGLYLVSIGTDRGKLIQNIVVQK